MDKSEELCFLTGKLIKQEVEEEEAKVRETEENLSETVEKGRRREAVVVCQTEEKVRQKEMKVSQDQVDEKVSVTEQKEHAEDKLETEEKRRQREAVVVSQTEKQVSQKEMKVSQNRAEEKISQAQEKISQAQEKVSQAEEKISQAEEKISQAEEKVSQTEKKVSQTEEKVSQTEKKVSEAQDTVSEKKAKVTFKLDLDEGDDSSTCSDRSFDNTETSAQSDSHTIVKYRKKGRRRGACKGGIRHKNREYYERCKDNFGLPQLSQRPLYLQEKDHAAAVSRYADEQYLLLYPAAPFNSTQFLMEDQYKNSPPEDTDKWLVSSASNSPKHKICALPLSPSETGHEEIHFPKRDQEFTDSFNLVQAESLQSLPKEELVKHFMHLEDKVAALHKQVTESELEQKQEQDDDEDVFSKEDKQKPYVYESVCNSETNSLSSNNEEFLDLSKVNQLPICVKESSVFVSDNTVSSTNFSSSESLS